MQASTQLANKVGTYKTWLENQRIQQPI